VISSERTIETVTPPTIEAAPEHHIVCHISLKDLEKVPSALPAAQGTG
jgi:hypothetical protein